MKGENTLKTLGRLAILLSLLFSLTACATSGALKSNPAAAFSFAHRDFDLRYAWNASQTDQGVRIDGLVKNVRYSRIDAMDIKISLLDKSRKVVAEGVAFPIPQPIENADYRNFGVLLRNAKLSDGDLLQFMASYNGADGPTSFPWTSSFVVNAATGVALGVSEKADDEW